MKYDVIVAGAGHAGCEAALASARLGLKTILLTINVDKVALMPCNPSIGGLGKSQLVRELDALGGQMAKTTDNTLIQIKVLNKRKGPAVQALRAQIDKKKYEMEMKKILENTKNLTLRQGIVDKILIKNGAAIGVGIESGLLFEGKAIIITTGTFLRGRIIIGKRDYSAGRMGEYPAMNLTRNLTNLSFKIGRFQTATPPRVDRRTVDFSKTEVQRGDRDPLSFSFWDEEKIYESIDCYLTYTNKKTHKIIAENIEQSPIKSGMDNTHGPRHCPSIDRKVINFPEKKRHPVFIEPEGVQTKKIENLYFAGQINGTSGYEEAAAQGFVAGVNAALKIMKKSPLVLTRDRCYIGVLIDDLITKELIEPYRMYTSRAEYRLILRSDNADIRLSKYGNNIGLITNKQYEGVIKREEEISRLISKLKSISLNPDRDTNIILERMGTKPIDTPLDVYKLLKRPEVDINSVMNFFYSNRNSYSKNTLKQAEIKVKYEGYIKRQLSEIKKFEGLEKYYLSQDLNYFNIIGLTYEAQEILTKIKPNTLGQASRIAGISPADISILILNLKRKIKKGV